MLRLISRVTAVVAVVTLSQVFSRHALGQATRTAENAGALYVQAMEAAEQTNSTSYPPSSSNLRYDHYPPFSAEWHRLESSDFQTNAPARKLVREARLLGHLDWSALRLPNGPIQYLNPSRGLCNILGDAAVWQHEQGDDAGAIETIRDMWGLADAVEAMEPKAECLLTGVAIRDWSLLNLNIVVSGVSLTSEPGNTRSEQLADAHRLIEELMKHADAKTEAAEFRRKYAADMAGQPARLAADIVDILIRVDTERDLAAMSLACHVYRQRTGRWPATLEDLQTIVPRLPIDPFGDGRQSLGYALIKSGLPDGSDRPLVYSRESAAGTLFFRVDRPEYEAYLAEQAQSPFNPRRPSGQFRDVASWSPRPGTEVRPTTRPLN
jgi:hypothetical protein